MMMTIILEAALRALALALVVALALGLLRAATFTPFTPLFNGTGQPAASLPLWTSAGGLPVGVQVVTRFGDEETLLALAAQLERAAPWAERHPAISA